MRSWNHRSNWETAYTSSSNGTNTLWHVIFQNLLAHVLLFETLLNSLFESRIGSKVCGVADRKESDLMSKESHVCLARNSVISVCKLANERALIVFVSHLSEGHKCVMRVTKANVAFWYYQFIGYCIG